MFYYIYECNNNLQAKLIYKSSDYNHFVDEINKISSKYLEQDIYFNVDYELTKSKIVCYLFK